MCKKIFAYLMKENVVGAGRWGIKLEIKKPTN
jgi:hypothetical protein